MTESEARSKIKYRLETARQIAGNGVDGKAFEDLEIAVQVLKEIREYRKIGKAEEIKKCIHSLATSCDELKDMLTKYEAIGTVDELQVLKEKNEPKKSIDFNEEEGTIDFICPNCNEVSFRQPYKPNNCKHCGQKLDWG